MTADLPVAAGYTEADVLVVADTLDEDISCEVWCAGCDSHRAARRVLAALAEAGRLLPAGFREESRHVAYASEHTNHGTALPEDPFVQETGRDRSLAETRVRVWSRRPGRHRLLHRDVITLTGPWVPVEPERGE